MNGTPGVAIDDVLARLGEREQQGSTFLNEGVALPHARLPGLTTPRVAVGLTHAGVLDAPTERPVEVVVLMLSPESGPASHLQLLAVAGRALQRRELRARLRTAKTGDDAFAILTQAR
jgi:mannitol/fructose-specific phosphotransferase system IIA component (Ntr-type)